MWIGPIGKKHTACHLGYIMDLYHHLRVVNSQQAEQITRSLRSLSVFSSFDNNMKILELYLVHKNVKTKQGFNKDWCMNLFCGGYNKLAKLWRCVSRVSYTYLHPPVYVDKLLLTPQDTYYEKYFSHLKFAFKKIQ